MNISPILIREIPTKALSVWVFHVIEKFCVLKTRLQLSDLRLNYENIASIKTTHTTKILLILLL